MIVYERQLGLAIHPLLYQLLAACFWIIIQGTKVWPKMHVNRGHYLTIDVSEDVRNYLNPTKLWTVTLLLNGEA